MGNEESRAEHRDIPESTDELREIIIKSEREGVNVDEAWRLYTNAKVLEGRKGDGDAAQAASLVAKAYSRILANKRLYRWSSGKKAVIFGLAPFVAVAVIIGVLGTLFRNEIVLTVPMIVLIWGLVGSGVFVLVGLISLIKNRVFEPILFLSYGLRFILGGVLAGIVFYIIQLGMVSLPGTTGETINASLERAAAAGRYREAEVDKGVYEVEIALKAPIIADFERAASGDVTEKIDVLLKYESLWGITLRKKPELKDRINREIIENKYDEYVNAAAAYREKKFQLDRHILKIEGEIRRGVSENQAEIERSKIAITSAKAAADETAEVEAIAKKKAAEDKEAKYRAFLNELKSSGDPGSKAEIILELQYLVLWSELAGGGGEKGELGFSAEDFRKTYEAYEAENATLGKLRRDLECYFGMINANWIPEVQNDIKTDAMKLARAEKDVAKWGIYFKSDKIFTRIEKLNDDTDALNKRKIVLEDEVARELRAKETPVVEEGESTLQTMLSGVNKELESKRAEKLSLDREWEQACREEAGKPVWEAAIFLVIAFLSGFSAEFSFQLLGKVRERLSNAPEDKETGTPEHSG